MPLADAAGRTLEYHRRGEGEPLLLIQGLSGTHASWGDAFLHALGPDLELVTYDHRGIGGSGPIDGPFTIADLAADAVALLDALGIESAHVLGISMGGMVAQDLVLARPERVRTLTLGCTYAGGPRSQITEPATIQRLLAAQATGDPEVILRAGFEINVSPAYAAQPGAWEAFRAAALSVRAPLPVIFEQMRATATHDTSARLGEVRAPTLVVHGDLDAMLTVENGRVIAELIPQARLEIFEGVGHLFWLERSQEAGRLIGDHARSGAAARPVA